MKKKFPFLIFVVSLLILISCNKKDSPTPQSVPVNNPINIAPNVINYYPLSQGSYWVYKQTLCDSVGIIIPQSWQNDSVIVKNDTIINNKTYHKVFEYGYFGTATPFIHFYRDSIDCIVNDQGKIIFSIKQPGLIFTDILSSDTVGYVNYTFNNIPSTISVPSGTFSCVDFKGDIHRKIDNYSYSRSVHKHACVNKGVVKKTLIILNNLQQINYELIAFQIL